jgi:periplasmic protein TonB
MAATVPATGAPFEPDHQARGERPLVLGYSLIDSNPAGRRRRAVTLPVSIALHSAGALALVAIPLLVSDSMPDVQTGVRAFLVEPLSVAPPPPPPAARPAAAPRVVPTPPPQQQAFVAPVEVPTEIVPEQALDLGGADQGVSGGVDGGVPGGVVGGIVGGLPDAPPAPAAPVRVGGTVREPKRLSAPPPVYPDLAVTARLQGIVIIEATINERGRVVSTTLLSGVPMLNEAALEAVKKWVYTPTLLNGVPTPVIMTVTVRFKLA